VSRLMASRARRLDTRKTFGFLAGWFRLASRVLQQNNRAANSPAGRRASNARQSTSIRLDYLSTFTNQHRSRAKKRLAFGVKSSTCV
jgi:hypothetical protein